MWCHEAMAYEAVPAARWNRSFMIRRALLQGSASRLHPTFGVREIAISLIAIPVWAIALPFSLILRTWQVHESASKAFLTTWEDFWHSWESIR